MGGGVLSIEWPQRARSAALGAVAVTVDYACPSTAERMNSA